jgi:hypothetical protein
LQVQRYLDHFAVSMEQCLNLAKEPEDFDRALEPPRVVWINRVLRRFGL